MVLLLRMEETSVEELMLLCWWLSVLFFSRLGPQSHLSAFAVFRPVFDTDSCACTGTEASPPLFLAVVWAALYSAQHHSCYRMLALLGQPLVLVPFHQLWPTSVETDKKLRVDKLNGKEFYQIAKGVLRKPADLCNQSFLEECALRNKDVRYFDQVVLVEKTAKKG